MNGTSNTDLRRTAYDLVVAGVAAGLPIPAGIDIPGHYPIFSVRVTNNDRGGADAWAAYLGLDTPHMVLLKGLKHDAYESLTYAHPALPGWKVEVTAFCDKDGAL